MKTTLRYLILFSAAFVMLSCTDYLYEVPSGSMIVSSESVKVGEKVNFNWNGSGSNIVFYNGEPLHKYANREDTTLYGATAIPEINFFYGDAKKVNWTRGWLEFKYSLDYDPALGAAAVPSATWVDLSDDFGTFGLGLHDPTKGGLGVSNASTGFIPLKELAGKKVTFAFRAVALAKAFGVDVTFSKFSLRVFIPELQIRVPMADIAEYQSFYYEPSQLTFSYGWVFTGGTFRFWNVDGSKNVQEEQAGWCVLPTQSFEFEDGVPYSGDNGVTVKTPSQNSTSWSHTYSKPGVYTVTTVATTYDPRSDKLNKVISEKTITVVE